ncbi:hypothetical protein MBRA_01058 [Methylobacterium brachiatum]|nr:hypothetical protein MBRA_01058 [Methylobacterium brachiatum]
MGRVVLDGRTGGLGLRMKMTKRNAKQQEHEPSDTRLLELIDLAERTRGIMRDYDAEAQAYFLLDTFDAADRVYAIWPDSSCQFGYGYSIMKGDDDCAAMRRIPSDAIINFAAIPHENADTARLMQHLHHVIRERPIFDKTYRIARAAWLGTTPANLAAMKERDEGNSPA